MGELVIPCFVEDDGHEKFLAALLARLAGEEGWPADAVAPDFRTSTKGWAKALISLRGFLRDVRDGRVPARPLLVVLVDGNCKGSQEMKRTILEVAERNGLTRDHVVVGIPDPHVERWFLDSRAMKAGVAAAAEVTHPRYKCEREHYKIALRMAFKPAGIIPFAGGVEYALDMMAYLDLERPACGDEALKDFADDLRAALRRLRPRR